MTADDMLLPGENADLEHELIPRTDYGLSRRGFLKVLGAGVVVTVWPLQLLGQARRGGGGGGGAMPVEARLHVGKDGIITVLTGKVEGGQGARAELTQAAAEELRAPLESIRLVMADTGLVPDDGITAGSGSTPRTVPAVRQGCAAARELLRQLAAGKWGVEPSAVEVRDGKAVETAGKREMGYAELAAGAEGAKELQKAISPNVELTPVKEWKVLGTPLPRPNRRDIVTGAHKYPSDMTRPGMLYGKVLRPASYGAKMTSIDPAAAKAMKDVVVVQDGAFVGVVAPSTSAAEGALAALAKTAQWDSPAHPSSKELFAYLREHVQGGLPKSPFADELSAAAKVLKQSYDVAYIQHAPLEPRVALAEWEDGKLTVWTATQNPFGVRGELERAMGVTPDKVRVIVPDFGGGFGGKHTGEAAVEAARLAKAAGKPVLVRWTRAEEFTWAYFRPAAAIDIQASLDAQGKITSWHFVNVNSGGAAIETPYRAGKAKSQFVPSESPLRTGSYRSLAATANHFARECFMDELAEAAGSTPLEFRLAHLENPRLRAVLEEAAKRFDWAGRSKKKAPGVGVGLACGTDKGSVVAACAEIEIVGGAIVVRRVCQVFECGAILNPANLLSQVQGAIMMGIGPALREAMEFEKGKVTNASFWRYEVPRLADLPELDIHLMDRKDQPSAGAGETPIVAIAPAIANAVFQAAGKRMRQMPMRLAGGKADTTAPTPAGGASAT
jgi:isoquinoline 1-oxidoreductase subunit beta